MVKRFVFILSILLIAFNAIGQNKPVWFEELNDLQVEEAKPVVILIMTGWCKYCHSMKNTMLKNASVSQLLGDKFRTVFLDAEEKSEIFFAGNRFKFKQGVNELATELATVNGRISYPTLCILNAENEIIYQYNGFLSAGAIEYTLKKISEIRYSAIRK